MTIGTPRKSVYENQEARPYSYMLLTCCINPTQYKITAAFFWTVIEFALLGSICLLHTHKSILYTYTSSGQTEALQNSKFNTQLWIATGMHNSKIRTLKSRTLEKITRPLEYPSTKADSPKLSIWFKNQIWLQIYMIRGFRDIISVEVPFYLFSEWKVNTQRTIDYTVLSTKHLLQ